LASDSLVNDTKAAMKKAANFFRSISTNGGYVGIYSLDLEKRYGESFYEKAGATEIWVQPPGTPIIGQCYLRALKVRGECGTSAGKKTSELWPRGSRQTSPATASL